MLDQSKSVVVEELKKRLADYQKRVEAIKDPSKIGELYKAQDIAKRIEEDLSGPMVRRYISSAEIQEVLRRTTQVLSLEQLMKPYQAQKAVNDLQLAISAFLESLPGKPKTLPKFPWKEEPKKSDEEKKEEEKKKDDDPESESSS